MSGEKRESLAKDMMAQPLERVLIWSFRRIFDFLSCNGKFPVLRLWHVNPRILPTKPLGG